MLQESGRDGFVAGRCLKEPEEAVVRCQVVIDTLSAFIDGELPDAKRQAVERHLGECPGCAAAHRRLAEAWALVAEAPRVGPRVDLWPAVEARLAGERPAPAWHAWLGWNPFPALATLALVTGLILGLQIGDVMVRDDQTAGPAPDVQAGRLDVQYFGDVFPGSLAEVILDVASPRAATEAPEVRR